MFYSHEVLTSRQYGVATVWLVATLGAKSTLKKVNRKAILEVDVSKACETIIAPGAPMALRLQSNLLYGVARVYGEQCSYVLLDAQNTQNSLRGLFSSIKMIGLEGSHKARPDQLNLKEDGRFMLENLQDLDLNFTKDLDFTSSGSSDMDSLLSPHRSISSGLGSEHADPTLGGIVIPPSASSSIAGLGGFSIGGSVHGGRDKGRRIGSSMFRREEDEHIVDPGFAFDALGNVVDSDPPVVDVAYSEAEQPTLRDPSVPNSNASMGETARIMSEQVDYQDGYDGLPPHRDKIDEYDDAQAFPTRHHYSAQASTPPRHHSDTSQDLSEPLDAASDAAAMDETAVAPALRIRKKKNLAPDVQQELHRTELSEWSANYLDHMQEASRGKVQARSIALAKQNADFWVLRNGVGDLSATFRQETIPEPLRMFSGDALLQALTGIRSSITGEKRPRDETSREVEDHADAQDRRVHARSNEAEMDQEEEDAVVGDAGPLSDNLIQSGGDIDYNFDVDMDEARDRTVEVGREAHTPLAEHMSSIMPWNNTSSIRGSSAQLAGRGLQTAGGFATSSAGGGSIGGLGTMGSRPGSRMVSASPFGGRMDIRATVEGFDDHPIPGLYFASVGDMIGGQADQNVRNYATVMDSNEHLEAVGPAAALLTQQADHTAWMREVLDMESLNFLNFMQAGIQDADIARNTSRDPPEGPVAGEPSVGTTRTILFEELLLPAHNSRTVAAQGLLHVLTLVTKNMIHAGQSTSFGPIKLAVRDATSVPGATAHVPVLGIEA